MDLTNLPLPSRSNAPVETQNAAASTCATPSAEPPPTIAARKSSAQRQREYRQRIAASRTPAQLIAIRRSDTERKRNYRLRKAANLAHASGSLQSTTASSSHSAERSNDVENSTQQQLTNQQRQSLAAEPAQSTGQPGTSSDQIEVQQTQSTCNNKMKSSIMRFPSPCSCVQPAFIYLLDVTSKSTMVIWCSAKNCSSKQIKGSGLSFHRFPMNPDLKQKWVDATGRDNFNPTKYSFLCGNHFKKEDYVQTFGQIKLREEAVPTIFNFENTSSSNIERNVQLNQINDSSSTTPKLLQLNVADTIDTHKNTVATRQRNRTQKVFLGEFNEKDMDCPKQAKRMFYIAKRNVRSKNQTITYLRNQIRKLEKKVVSLETSVDNLKSNKETNEIQQDGQAPNTFEIVKIENSFHDVKMEETLQDMKIENILQDVENEVALHDVKIERSDYDEYEEKFNPPY